MEQYEETQLTATLRTAMTQAGVDWIEPGELGAMVSSAVSRDTMAPWWRVHKWNIIDQEANVMDDEGLLNVHLSVAGHALVLIREQGPTCVGRKAMRCALKAADAYRESVRRMWQTPNGMTPLHSPIGEVEDMPEEDYSLPDELDESPEFVDFRLTALWEVASPVQREFLRLLSDGQSQRMASALLGYSEAWGNVQLKKLKRKAGV